jgi:hypothetical protein
MDTKILFGGGRDEYLESADYLPPAQGIPRCYEVVEVIHEVRCQNGCQEVHLNKLHRALCQEQF